MNKIKNILPLFVLSYPPLTLISISFAEIVLFSGLILYFILIFKRKITFEYPKFFIALIFYAVFSIISALFSYLPITSLFTLKELFLIFSIPFVYSVLKEYKSMISKTETYFFYAVIISSLYSVFQFIHFLIRKNTLPRSYGFESHYMTQAGLMMILAIYSFSFIVNLKGKTNFKIYTIFILTSLSLLLTLTRSAWLGFFVAALILLLKKKPALIFALVIFLAVILLISPTPIKKRFSSFANFKDITFQNRILMIKKGIRMIKDKPLWGVGPGMVKYAYTVPRYKVKEKEELHSHLHNDFIQIWAERGVFSFLSWIFFIIYTFYTLIKLKPESETFKSFRDSAIFIFLGFLIAGLFEFNFGDSEVLMLLYFFLTIPFLKIKKDSDNISK